MIGDRLLVQVSKRIKSTLREADIAARLGGDEFAIILNNNYHADETAALAHRLVETVGLPYEFDDDIVSIGVSASASRSRPINGTRPDQILRNADLALYRAKAEGRGTWRFFESQMDSDVRERRMLELELRQALKEGEFVLHYQPLVSARGQQAERVRGAGALEPSDARHRAAGRVHSDRRADRPDQADRRLDDPRSLSCRGALAGRPARRGQPFGQALPDVRHHRGGARSAGRVEAAAAPPRAGDHREPAHRAPGRGRRKAGRAEGARRDHRHGRFRHRLFQPFASAEIPVRQDQDRPVLRHRLAGGCRSPATSFARSPRSAKR